MCIAYESYQNGEKEEKEMQISLTWQSLQSRKQCEDLSSPHKVRPTLVRSDEKVWASPACYGCAPFLELICSAPLPHYPAFSHPKVPQQCFTKETSEVIREVLLKALIPMCVERSGSTGVGRDRNKDWHIPLHLCHLEALQEQSDPNQLPGGKLLTLPLLPTLSLLWGLSKNVSVPLELEYCAKLWPALPTIHLACEHWWGHALHHGQPRITEPKYCYTSTEPSRCASITAFDGRKDNNHRLNIIMSFCKF